MPRAKKIRKIEKEESNNAEEKTDKILKNEEENSQSDKNQVKIEIDSDIKEENAEITTKRKQIGIENKLQKRVKKEEEGGNQQMDGNGSVKMVRELAKTSRKLLGAHVSAQGGLENAIKNAIGIGCQAFALFIRNQRRWESKPMDENTVQQWNQTIKETGFSLDRIVPHGSYLLNAGSPDPKKLEMTRNAMLDECCRCERLGIGLYNFHPGSTTGIGTEEECLARIAETINYLHGKTKFITLVVETMCGSGNQVGGKFEHLRAVIDQVKDKNRVGVCIDTCHSFAAGYNIAQKDGYEKAMEEFDKIVGFKYLKAVHLNDSMGKLSSKLDRHCNIGKGYLGDDGFELLMNDPRFDKIPMVLETPVPANNDEIYTEEMCKLYAMEKKIKKEE